MGRWTNDLPRWKGEGKGEERGRQTNYPPRWKGEGKGEGGRREKKG